MGTKNNPGEYDCYSKAEPDEPMFILLARDDFAPKLVETWARHRRLTHGDADLKAKEADDCALLMEAWLKRHPEHIK